MSEPRFATPQTPSRSNLLPAARKIAAALGMNLMDHQERIIATLTEQSPEGLPVFSNATVSTPRQCGKTVTALVLSILRSFRPGQRTVYCSTTGSAARGIFNDEWLPLLAQSEFAGMYTVRLTNGAEMIRWNDTGSTVALLSSTRHSGHGETLDLILADEIWSYQDDRLDQLQPATITRPGSQFIAFSTSGTPSESPYLLARVEQGRADVEAGLTDTRAYLEWSIDPADIDNFEAYVEANPAVGQTVSPEALIRAIEGMDRSEAARAYGNIFVTAMHDPIIPLETWNELQDDTSEVASGLVFAVDVAPDRGHATIACAGRRADDKWHCGVVESGEGVAWLPARLRALVDEAHPKAVYVDKLSASLLPDFERLGIQVTHVDSQGHAAAHAYFLEQVNARNLRHHEDDELFDALRVAGVRPLGDGGQAWSRRGSNAAIDTLVACTLALYGANLQPGPIGIWSGADLQEIVRAKWKREGLPDKVLRDPILRANLMPNFDMRPKSEERRRREREVTYHRC